MLSEWTAVFRTPSSIAETVLHKLIGYLEDKASELIWKPRCTATINWEQKADITLKAKTAKYTGPRGEWSDSYGYIIRDGFCICGASLAAYENRYYPGLSSDPSAADTRLWESLLEKRQLSLMERMGRILFIRMCK